MDIQTLESFFMWCTIINGAIYIVWVMFFMFAPDFVYRVQSYFKGNIQRDHLRIFWII